MEPFEEIKARLRKYSDIQYEVRSNFAVVYPATDDGFSVTLERDSMNNEYTIGFGEVGHVHVAGAQEALEWFAFALSDECRLKTVYRDKTPVRGTIEKKTRDGWETVNETVVMLPLFWRPKRIETKQNKIITSAGDS